jgi:hypothetical protein
MALQLDPEIGSMGVLTAPHPSNGKTLEHGALPGKGFSKAKALAMP